MMKDQTLLMMLLFSAATPALAEQETRFITQLTLATGQTAVVAEGDWEARSVGSFSVRLYAAAPKGDETTFFVAGVIQPRDGVLENVMLANVYGSAQPEIIVTARSAGSGSYQSAYGFEFDERTLVAVATAEGFSANEDPAKVLSLIKRADK